MVQKLPTLLLKAGKPLYYPDHRVIKSLLPLELSLLPWIPITI